MKPSLHFLLPWNPIQSIMHSFPQKKPLYQRLFIVTKFHSQLLYYRLYIEKASILFSLGTALEFKQWVNTTEAFQAD